MKPEIKNENSFIRDVGVAASALLLSLLLLCGLYKMSCPTAEAQLVAQSTASINQATALVTPRVYLVVSNLFMTNSQFFGTGTITNTNNLASILGPSWPSWITNQNVYALAPTMMAPQGASEIGLTAIIQTTNNLAHASNMVVTVYPAYDTSGGSTASVSARYGQLFGASNILTWTINYTTNGIYTTNIAVANWRPATSLGYTISNGITSNTTFTLMQSDVP
jgi:hypothetical protein